MGPPDRILTWRIKLTRKPVPTPKGKKSPCDQASPVDVTGGDWLYCSLVIAILGVGGVIICHADLPAPYPLRQHLLMSV